MISIVVCSVKPTLAAQFMSSVKSTIGDVEHEFLIFDNRDSELGIAAVYNRCAEQAKYPMLCFAHEDVIVNTKNWGRKIVDKLNEPDCGVVGFAGSTVKSRGYSGWGQNPTYNRCNFIQHFADGSKKRFSNIDKSVCFDSVVTLDGLALFVRKNVWNDNKFDEDLLKGFHCYDIDFTLQVNLNYNNYICNCMEVEHLSTGSYNKAWFSDTKLLHDQKWGDILPVATERLSDARLKNNERSVEYMFVKNAVKMEKDKALRRDMVISYIKKYWMLNGSIDIIAKHLRH